MLDVKTLSNEELYIIYYSIVGFDYTIEPETTYKVYKETKEAIEKEWIERERNK